MTTSLAAVAAAKPAAPSEPVGKMSAKAAAQIAALQRVKTSLTTAERKLDSRLALAARARTDATLTRAVPRLAPPLAKGQQATEVDISVSAVSNGLLTRLRAVGATVRYASPTQRSVRATVPVSSLTTVAGWSDVRSVREAARAMTARANPRPAAATRPETKQERAARLDATITKALRAQAAPRAGAVTSEGDATHGADTARRRFHVTGTGVKVCAMSDGVDSLAASVASGELPPVDVLPDQEGSGDEGTAMLEIIHDLAPNAELGFATAFNGDASFADNIRRLRTVSRCDIIVDDVLYFNESPFQDGPIAQSVNFVASRGALYFSSAGNEGNVIDGTSGSYEGDFVDSGETVGKFAGAAHDFDPGAGVQAFEPLSDASAEIPVTLFWSDPLGASGNDYDLYLLDSEDNVTNFSQDVQNGDDNPYEILGTGGDPAQRLAVVKFSGADRYFQLSALRGRYVDSADGLVAYTTPGVTRGHSAVDRAFSTAAAPADTALPFDLEPGDPPNPTGPFPGVFTSTQAPERFTSDGPRRVFYKADGTPYTPGNVSSTGGTVRQKPNITAADGVSTSVGDFELFFGTSAAAPHAAAIAALALSGNPGAPASLVRSSFYATALDLAPAGVDSRTGRGIVLATRVLTRTGATPQPLVTAGTPTVTPGGDGDAYLEPGETGVVALPVTNVGDGAATGVSVRPRVADRQVRLTPAARSYGTIAAGATASRDFTVTLDPSYPLGKRVRFSTTVTFAGALSPTSATASLATGQPASTSTTYPYAGPPVAIPDADPTGASVPIEVGGGLYASSMTVSVDGDTCTTDEGATTVGLDHTFVGDLVGTLTSPSGQRATLFSGSGGSGNNLCQVVFDDAASVPLSSATSEAAPFTGTWQPVSPLAALLDATVPGTWTFRATDLASADEGSIRAVSLHVTGFVP